MPLCFGLAAAAVVSCAGDPLGGAPREAGTGPVEISLTVLGKYPHDRGSFTQGLLWHEGKLYETTGLRGRSRLRRVELESGAVEQETALDRTLFGEGLTLIPGGSDPDHPAELLWLTWTAGRALRFDLETFAPLGEHPYEGQGWGLCWMAGDLYRTDGTAILWRHDPVDFSVRGRLQVMRNGAPVGDLNELECTPDGILANVWQSDEILRLDPATGRVTGVVDASGLLPAESRRSEAVLNGIAYRPETGTYLLTGKYWPWVFEVAFIEPR